MKAFALLLVGLAVVTAGPVRHHHKRELPQSPLSCAQRCTGTQNKYTYKTGHSYVYQLDSSTDVEIPNYDKHNSNVTQRAQLTISVHAPCEYQMKINSLVITGTQVPSSFATTVSAHAIRFAMDDGRITSVCPSPDDAVWVVNMKRSILSALQNAFEADQMKVDEDDVAGACQSTYAREESGDDWSYTRTKHVQSCRGHHNIHGSLRAQAYDVNSDTQSAPASNAHHECRHTVTKAGVLKTAVCTEWNEFTPFTNRQAHGGAIRSTTRMRIVFVSERNGVDEQSSNFERQSLMYDDSEMDYSPETHSAGGSVNDLLKRLCDSSNVFVAKETPSQFVSLVAALRQQTRAQLDAIIAASKAKPQCTRQSAFLMDALPMCGSESCVGAMTHILKTDSSLSDADRFAWFTSLAFVPRATIEMVRAVVPLVEKDDSHKRGLLGVSSLVHTYCQQNANCASEPSIKQLVAMLDRQLGENCHVSSADVTKTEQMVLVLKALGNIGHVYDAVEKLVKCVESTKNPVQVRVAAVQAMRRLPCEHAQRTQLLRIYRDQSVDVEVRISAFLTLVKCPTRALVDEINVQLADEKVKQVGAFVWSYLTARRTSSDPTQSTLRRLLRDTSISRRFDLDSRRYSGYSEMGSFTSATNTGAHVEQGLVFVPGSHTPRAAWANLTVHMFGHSVNFFELGARAEGMDNLLENLVGPEGMLSAPIKNFGGKKDNAKDDEFSAQSEKHKQRPHYEARDRLALSMYLRVFGDELAYFGYDDPQVMDSLRAKADFSSIIEFLATQRNMEMSKNVVFMDFTKTLPTMGGLPLRLQITGAAALNVKVEGKADLTQMLRRPHNINIQSSVRPSAAIEIATTLSIQVGGVRSGVRLLSRMHTNTAMESKVTLKDGKVFSASWAVPQDEQTIVDFEFTGNALVNNADVSLVESSVYTQDEYCTPTGFNKVLGLKTCLGVSVPKVAGHLFPRRAWLKLSKTDAKLEKYELTVEAESNGVFPVPKRFTIDTPGSQVDRKVMLAIEQVGDKNVLHMHMPGRKLALEGDLNTGERDRTSGQLTLTVDAIDKYIIDAEVKRTGEGHRRRTELTATCTMPGRDAITFTSHMEMNGFTQLDAGLVLTGLDAVSTQITARVHMPTPEDEKFALAFNYQCPNYMNKLEIDSLNKPNNFVSKWIVEHKSMQSAYAPVTLRFDWEQKAELVEKDTTHITRKFELVKSLHPQSNFLLTAITHHSTKHGNLEATLKYGDQLSHEMALKFARKNEEAGKYEFDGSFDAAEMSIQQKFKANYEYDYPRRVHAKLLIEALAGGDEKSMEFTLHQPRHASGHFDVDAELSAKYAAMDINWRVYKEIRQMSTHDYKSKTIVQWRTDKQIEVNGDVKMQNDHAAFHYLMDGTAKISGVAEPIRIHKAIHITSNQYKYAALFERGTRKLYDANFTMTTDGADVGKTTFESRLESHYLYTGDYRMNGAVDRTVNTRALDVNLLKNSQPLARLQATIPKRMTRWTGDEEKHVKLHLTWDLIVAPKELLTEYRLQHDGTVRRHHMTAMTKLDKVAHKWQGEVVKDSPLYKMNNTYWQNDKQVVVVHWGTQHKSASSEYNFDFGVRTDAPLTHQDVVGSALLVTNPKDAHLRAIAKCNVRNKQVLTEFRWKNPSSNNYDILAELEAGDVGMRVESKMSYPSTGHYDWSSNSRFKWAADKQITRVDTLQRQGAMIKFDSKLSTPFSMLRDYEVKYERRCETGDLTCTNAAQLTVNSEQKLKVNMESHYDAASTPAHRLTERTIKVITSRASLGEIVAKYKNVHAQRDGMLEHDFESTLTWAETNKLRVHRVYAANDAYTKMQYLGAWEAHVKEYANTKARYEYKQDGKKHSIEAHLKRNDDDYKINAEFDEQKTDGTVKIVTPHTPLKTGAIKVVRKADGEYEISTERNGHEGAQLVGTIKTRDHLRSAHFKIDNIETPMQFDAEMDADERRLKFVVTKNYNTVPLAYGVHVAASENRKALTVDLPARRPHIEWRTNDDGEVQLWLQADSRTNGREPTKLIARRTLVDSTTIEYSLRLIDPSLPHPLFVSARTGVYTASECGTDVALPREYRHCGGARTQFVLSYAGDETNRMMIDVDFFVALAQEGETGVVQHVSVTAAHPSLHYRQRWYYTMRVKSDEFVTDLGVDTQKDTASGERKYLAQMIFNHQSAKLQMKLRSPTSTSTLHFVRDAQTNEIRVMFVNDHTQKTSWVLAVLADSPKYQVEIRRQANSDVILHASDNMPNDQTFESRLWHKDRANKRHDDVFIKFWLEEADLLKVRMHVTPESWRNLLEQGINTNEETDHTVGDNVFAEIFRDNVDHWSKMSKDVGDVVRPMVAEWKREQTKIQDDMGISSADLYNTIIDYYELAREVIMAQMDIMEMSLNEWTATNSLNNWRQNIRDMRASLRAGLTEMMTPIGEGYNAMIELFKRIAEQLNEAYENVQKMLDDNAYLSEIKETMSRWMEKVKRVSNYDNLRDTISSSMGSSSSGYSSQLNYVLQCWDAITSFPFIHSFYSSTLEPAFDEIATFDLRDIVARLIAYAQELADGQTTMGKYLPKVTYYKPSSGEIEIQLPLPVRSNSLYDLVNQFEPDSVRRYFDGVRSRVLEIVSTDGPINEDLWQSTGARTKKIEDFDWNTAKNDFAPAHTATGIITGAANVITFDGSVYTLSSGDCEYLLAKDFLNNKFTVTANLAAGGLSSLRVRFGDDKVEMNKNGQVTINGKSHQLPYQRMDSFEGQAMLKIVRKDHSVELNTRDGVKVDCDWYNQLCAVTLPGFYHGQSNGLLGSNDLESGNDMHMPDGTSNDDVAAFAQSWLVGGRTCRVTAVAPTPTQTRVDECDTLFRRRQSPLRTCFGRVAPRAYHTLCTQTLDKCNATVAYVRACKEQTGLELMVPEECLSCRKSESSASETIVGGEESRVNARHHGADIVFVVEERPCMKFIKTMLVSNIAEKLQSGLGKLSKDVHYGVIGFGGEEVHNEPHFHTGENSINMKLSGLREAVASLAFESVTDMQAIIPVVDPIVAVEYATNYPFRSSVAKVIVLLTCTECGGQADYYQIQQALLTHNIQLHIMTTQMIQMGVGASSASNGGGSGERQEQEWLGFSASAMYTLAGERTADRASLSLPHDSCTVLAQEVAGTVWSVHDEESSVLTMPVSVIAAKTLSAFDANTCLVCECDAFELAPRTTCVTCEVPVPQSLAGSSFFNVPYIKLRQTMKKAQEKLGVVDAWLM